ncbi:DUF58 domain-containing protein [Demequina mangrovi]|uniref:Uncharacterized conserved protein, DUF58 family, contains vWF domain n=1 Tax=Demequina mangrovi TaxID=1043493 RepID=A0A1H6WVC1_9MICO|nr:DUF58 domain-containing protein [Demequina mangrovi]SEJ20831.1 Uncharacterized conserved protein, DUF58 family, contains vWF domain [Demequina mangrovi]
MHITGWTVALAALGAVPAALTQSRGVAVAWAVGVLALALLDVWLAPSTSTVGVRRDVPTSVRLTRSTVATVTLANLGRRRVRGAVRDAWQPSAGAGRTRHPFSLARGDSIVVRTDLAPTRRGDRHAGPVTIRTEGPLRLAGRQRSLDVPARLRVLPEFASRRHLPSRLRRLREIDGRTAVQLKGAGAEFDSLRDYVIGDDVRSIDWRGTARRGEVVVRTYRPERDRRVVVALDCARLSAARVGDGPRLDASIEASLLLAALASRAGDRVQATAFDRSEQARAASSGPAFMTELADALATVEASLLEPDWPALVRLIESRVSQRSLVVLLTTVETSALDSGLIEAVAALQHRHQVLVGSVEDPELGVMLTDRGDSEALYGAGAAARAMLEREAVATRLRQLGAEVVLALPDDLAPAVCDRYLALKAAGRL